VSGCSLTRGVVGKKFCLLSDVCGGNGRLSNDTAGLDFKAVKPRYFIHLLVRWLFKFILFIQESDRLIYSGPVNIRFDITVLSLF